ncbi:co(2)-response secreted protease [Phtheirospermum japonicum]|uniref:Co(2)-response secreted protease n=1 Tax=Phtheirospermum japonicum TaxID=374723 RepID=A0A830BHS6_9LAMI|nr:co(2)-response secreted protease [Phtheirospermum japonicum]
MGAASPTTNVALRNHIQLLSELMKREKTSVVHTYSKSFSGYAAHLSDGEAQLIARQPGVVSVFRDRVYQLQTTRSKVIGARYYDDPDELVYITSARDEHGHGTHVASTAAGLPVWGASYYGLASGTARGGSPGSRIAMYRVCVAEYCPGSGILKAFDDAIADGVDVISISIGGEVFDDFANESISIGAFHAVEKGIIVVASAGNDGPSLGTVVKVAPWILTVAATTMDRDFETRIVLGRNKVIKGGGINFSGLKKSAVYPLVDGRSASSNQHDVFNASNCIPGSLDGGKVKGKIIVCENSDADSKFDILKSQLGVIGMIVIGNDIRQVAFSYGASPIATVMEDDGAQILSYINSTSLAATVKSLHPTWSPSAIRSAIMTTAITTNNLYSPITTLTGLRATPYDIGAGEITLCGPLWPGLVYETETTDYLRFLCNYGYNTSTIKRIASTVPDNFACPSNSNPVLISDMNYPSIAVSGLKANVSRTVKRTLTNVGDEYSTYYATVETPIGMEVQVVPKLLRFTKTVKKLSFQVNFILTKTSKVPLFGSITWSNWKYKVRSPIVVSNT